MLEIRDSVAVITGAASGIGREFAKYWTERGGKAVLADLTEESLEAFKKELQQSGADVISRICDVTLEDHNERLARDAIDTYGKINLVLPCAGIIKDGLFLSPDKETGKIKKKMSLLDFQQVVDINLNGVFLTVRECAEQMVNSGSRGLICLVSSTSAQGTAGQINYSSTKAAMATMPRVITAEFFRKGLAERLRCVAVAPGYVGTEMVRNMNQNALQGILEDVPIGRLVEPSEVASFIGELYRNEALAGEVFPIHGGLRLGSKG